MIFILKNNSRSIQISIKREHCGKKIFVFSSPARTCCRISGENFKEDRGHGEKKKNTSSKDGLPAGAN
jgi:hypothetical protein